MADGPLCAMFSFFDSFVIQSSLPNVGVPRGMLTVYIVICDLFSQCDFLLVRNSIRDDQATDVASHLM